MRQYKTWEIVLIIVPVVLVLFVALFIGVRDLRFMGSPAGRCMLQVQPSILVGFSPSLVTELDC